LIEKVVLKDKLSVIIKILGVTQKQEGKKKLWRL
jgi:hypothetical protein